jgi:UDP:flavonoid glycosyltransferase YjiC (YdhE family)
MPSLGAVREIFEGAENFMTGVPELDHYGPRDPRHYIGLHAGVIGTVPPHWPEGDGPRVFAYLNSSYRHTEAAVAALAGSRARCLVHLAGATPALREKYDGSPHLAFSSELLDIDRTASECDLSVCHGTMGTVIEVLRRGKPLLLLPMDLEKFLLARIVEKMGAGRLVHPESPDPDIAGALARALEDAALAGAARAFAERHREPSVDTIVQRAAERFESLARGSPA